MGAWWVVKAICTTPAVRGQVQYSSGIRYTMNIDCIHKTGGCRETHTSTSCLTDTVCGRLAHCSGFSPAGSCASQSASNTCPGSLLSVPFAFACLIWHFAAKRGSCFPLCCECWCGCGCCPRAVDSAESGSWVGLAALPFSDRQAGLCWESRPWAPGRGRDSVVGMVLLLYMSSSRASLWASAAGCCWLGSRAAADAAAAAVMASCGASLW